MCFSIIHIAILNKEVEALQMIINMLKKPVKKVMINMMEELCSTTLKLRIQTAATTRKLPARWGTSGSRTAN